MHKISPHEQDSGFGELVQESIIPLVFVRKKPHLELIDSESVGDHKRENAFVSETTDLALVTVWVLMILASHDYVVFSMPERWFCRSVCPVLLRVVLEHPSDNIVRLTFAQLLVRLVLFCIIRHDRPQFGTFPRHCWFHW